MATPDEALRDAQRQMGELYLAGHLEKHDMEQEAVRTALEAEKSRLEDHRTAHQAAHIAHEDKHRIIDQSHREQHAAEQRAVLAATQSMDRRLDAMNEFRDQLRDQAATFLRREQLEAFIARYEKAHDEVLQLIATEREERRGAEGTRRGIGQSTGILVGTVAFAATALGIVVIVVNLLTGP